MTQLVQKSLSGVLMLIWCLQLLQLQPISFHVQATAYGDTASQLVREGARTLSVAPIRQSTLSAVNTLSDTAYDSVVFLGDVLLARNVEYLMEAKGAQYPFSGYDFTGNSVAPAVVANFESAVPAIHEPTPALQMTFSTQNSALRALQAAGVTHVSVANNHSGDYGREGFVHTVGSLVSADITPIGTPYKPDISSISYLQVKDQLIALIAIQALDAQKPTEAEISKLFTEANKHSSLQVVFIHWGTEYEEVSNSFQHTYAATLIANGADAIIGHHPHVVQEVGVIDGVPVFYSVGNYIFDQYFNAAVQTGLVLQLFVDGVPGVSLLPVSSVTSKSQPRPLSPLAHQAFLHDLAERSDSTIKNAVENGFVPLKVVATSSKIAMID